MWVRILSQENGDNHAHLGYTNGPALSTTENGKHMISFVLTVLTIWKFIRHCSAVARQELEGEKEAYDNAEWKERIEKWKIRQEKRGLVTKDAGDKDDREEEDYL